MDRFKKARELLEDFKGDAYLHGNGVIPGTGPHLSKCGKSVLIVADHFPGSEVFIERIRESLDRSGISIVANIDGAEPNAPREDLERITDQIRKFKPEMILSFGGGSTIDAAKAAGVLYTLGGSIDDYFGTGLVSEEITGKNAELPCHCAIQTASSSAAHLTKYSNITDMATGQKKLIVDPAIVPQLAIFDYETTLQAPQSLTVDGAMDGIAHSVEVLYQMAGKPGYDLAESVARECVGLVIEFLPAVLNDPSDKKAREALGLATDLGGYAIMIGGTNGPHLTSFSLVDIMSHGNATGLLLPYYTVFFAPAIQDPLRMLGEIFKENGLAEENITSLSGRELGIAVAGAMLEFENRSGFKAMLSQVEGYTEKHRERALTAAKNPQLKMKLENMPVPLDASQVDRYMKPVLLAAETGNLNEIENVE